MGSIIDKKNSKFTKKLLIAVQYRYHGYHFITIYQDIKNKTRTIIIKTKKTTTKNAIKCKNQPN